jgi:hypothetical protein
MNDLEQALFDLGAHLDHPAGDELVARVTSRLRDDDAPARDGHANRSWMLAAAAAVVVVLLGLAAFTPTREAIAGWLGIGAVEIRERPAPAPGGTTTVPRPAAQVPGSVGSTAVGPRTTDGGPADLARAQQLVRFPITLPDEALVGRPTEITIDRRPPGGLVAVEYQGFSLLEVGSAPGQAAVIGKFADPGVEVERVRVAGNDALWVTGQPHEVAYIDQNGQYRTDTVRRAGNVLVWAKGDVTYRIEGASDLAAARSIAETID